MNRIYTTIWTKLPGEKWKELNVPFKLPPNSRRKIGGEFSESPRGGFGNFGRGVRKFRKGGSEIQRFFFERDLTGSNFLLKQKIVIHRLSTGYPQVINRLILCHITS